MVAASLAFTTVLSIIPFLAVALTVIQYVEGLDYLYPKVEALILNYFRGPAGSDGVLIIKKAFHRIQDGRLGTAGALALLITSTILISEMERAFHRIWKISNKRPLFNRIFLYWLAMVLFPFILAVFVALTSTKAVIAFVPIEYIHTTLIFLTLLTLYKVVPATKVPWLGALLGASVATVGVGFLLNSFRWIYNGVFNYSKVYGGIAAIPAFLIWILLLWYVVLFGVAICGGKGNSKS